MDSKLRNLEHEAVQDPYNEQLQEALANEYIRSGSFLAEENTCDLFDRGMFEGGYFSCFSGVYLLFEILEYSRSFTSRPGSRPAIDGAWSNSLLGSLMPGDPSDQRRKVFLELLDYHDEIRHEDIFNPVRDMNYNFVMSGWQPAEQLTVCNNKVTWAYGRARNSRHGVEWQETDEGVDGISSVDITFNWPLHYKSVSYEGRFLATPQLGNLPSCKIRYNNPTPEMAALLCRLNTKFFSHTPLPIIPPMQDLDLIPPAPADEEEYYNQPEVSPLRIRGELVMPSCEQLQEIDEQKYGGIYAEYGRGDSDKWMFRTTGTDPVCVRCPGCRNVFSVYKNSNDGDAPGCYCDNCQFPLVVGYYGSRGHILAFARQHGTHTIGMSYPHNDYPLYIPDDCPPETRQKILDYYVDRLV